MIAFSVQKKALFRFRTQVVLELLGVQLYFVFSGTRQSTLSGGQLVPYCGGRPPTACSKSWRTGL